MNLLAFCQNILTESLYQQAVYGHEYVSPKHLAEVVAMRWLDSNSVDFTDDEICLTRLKDWFNEIIRVRPEEGVIYESIGAYLVYCIKDTIFYLLSDAWTNADYEKCSSGEKPSFISEDGLLPIKLDMNTAAVLIEEVKKVAPIVP